MYEDRELEENGEESNSWPPPISQLAKIANKLEVKSSKDNTPAGMRLNPNVAHESDYMALFNHMLFELFCTDLERRKRFYICPQAPAKIGSGDAIDLVVFALEGNKRYPVFFVEIKPPSWYQSESKRKAAIKQMADRFDAYSSQTDIDEIWGMQTIGCKWRLMCVEREGKPVDARAFVDLGEEHPLGKKGSGIPFNQTDWFDNVISADGEEVLRWMAGRILSMVRQDPLNDDLCSDGESSAGSAMVRAIVEIFPEEEMRQLSSEEEEPDNPKDTDYQPPRRR